MVGIGFGVGVGVGVEVGSGVGVGVGVEIRVRTVHPSWLTHGHHGQHRYHEYHGQTMADNEQVMNREWAIYGQAMYNNGQIDLTYHNNNFNYIIRFFMC